MKKLMFAATALICGAVLADGEITSQNIVGYAGSDLDDNTGGVFLTPLFVGVSDTEQIKLGDIVPVASGSYVLESGDVDAQLVDSEGYTQNEYWYKWDGSKWVYTKKTSTHAKGADASDVIIPAGQALFFGCAVPGATASVTLRSSGQVRTEDIVQKLDEGGSNVFVGNGFPVSVTLGDISLEPRTTYVLESGDVDIQIVDNEGYTQNEYWYKWDGEKWAYTKKTSTHAKGADASSVIIPAGQGFQVGCGVGSVAVIDMRIPVPTSIVPES